MNNFLLDAQVKDTVLTGEVKGIVADTTYRHRLKSATVAVYTKKDSTLLQYRLSNERGEFYFLHLPVDEPLYLIASYLGYKESVVRFSIPKSDALINLNTLPLIRAENDAPPVKSFELREVIVNYVPPVRMNGDTLEFNADAVTLDKSAVVEDLLRRLPGVTLWGDGSITVNGKEVSSVKVDGKPFFTGDPKIALQNLPKDAVEKIQVYTKKNSSPKSLDPSQEVNIKLKKDKKSGAFGKFGGGSNFRKKKEAELSANFFNSRSQIGAVWAKNNVNRIPNDINSILRNTTYKGINTGLEYSPDFELRGVNQSESGGFIYQHDFISNPTPENNNRINGNYFLRDLESTLNDYSRSTFGIDDSNYLHQLDTTKEKSRKTDHSLYSRYNLKRNDKMIDVSTSLRKSSAERRIAQTGTINNINGLLSSNAFVSESSNSTNDANLSVNGEMPIWAHQSNKYPKKFTYGYSIAYGEISFREIRKTESISPQKTGLSRFYDRSYSNNLKNFVQALNLSVGNLSPWLFGRGHISRIESSFVNKIKISTSLDNNKVADWDDVSSVYETNPYISSDQKYLAISESPALKLRRIFNMNLANRYLKTVDVSVSLAGSFFWQDNRSDHASQAFKRRYSDFTPLAKVSYSNYQLGSYHRKLMLQYARTIGYPTPNQLVPLVDSSNQHLIILPNINLKSFKNDEISFDISHETLKKNVFSYSLNITAGKATGALGDFISFDAFGRRRQYFVNLSGHRYVTVGGTLKKLIDFKENRFQFHLNTYGSLERDPNIINNEYNISHIIAGNANVGLYYGYRDVFEVELRQTYSNFSSRQSGIGTGSFENHYWNTSLAGSFRLTGTLSAKSDIQYKKNLNSYSSTIDYTLWNAHIVLRALNNSNLELKLSAFDILAQNSVVQNTGNSYLMTQSISNGLRKYYMLTLAYYPRRFGKRGHPDE